jgi:phosphopantothenoylcysteine decarboxylase/phosphopantothenate--cysteine ligase
MLTGKRVLLAVSGGIAAYRAAELARLLIKQGAEVRCVMTRGACEFITPLTFEALTGQQVHTELFDLTSEREMGHIKLARWADVLLVAPATADIIARFAYGICDNLLSTLFQARRGPVLLAPAMNTVMWQAPATQRNVQLLQQDGVHIVGPAAGDLACGETGAGRMSEPMDIVAAVYELLFDQGLAGQHWVINAGPTREAWDDVRTLSNRASGLLGSLIAEEAAMRGAVVQLIAGPGTPATPGVEQRRDVESAEEMLAACVRAAVGADVFIASAAVSDYRFAEPINGKLKRGAANDGNGLTVQLLENTDIVAYIAAMDNRPETVVGFAAEATDHLENARSKLRAKGVDAIFANDISRMGESRGGGWWLSSDDECAAAEMDKTQLAAWIVQRVIDMQSGKQ